MNCQRNFSKLVLGLAVAVAAVLPARAAEADKYLPSDTGVVAYVNIRQILDSPVVKKYALDMIKDGIKNNSEAKKIFEAAGIDPLTSLSSVTVASTGSPSDGNKFLVIARGTFDTAKIQAVAEKFAKDKPDEFKITKDGDITLYEGKNKDGGEPMFAAFLSKETMVASPTKSMVLDAGKKTGSVKKELAELLTKVDEKQSMWIAGLMNDELRGGLKANPQTANIADKLKALSASIGVTNSIDLDLSIHATDEKAAAEVKKLADGVKAFLGLFAGQNEEFAAMANEILDTVKITTVKTSVSVTAKVSADVIEKGAAKIKK